MLFALFRRKSTLRTNLFRSAIFGLEDALVSSVGFLSGYVAAGAETSEVIKSGLILIMVEAFSMGAGTLLSENNAEEISVRRKVRLMPAIQSGIVMAISYAIGGISVLSPYFVFPPKLGSGFSVAIALFGLSGIGLITAHYARTSYATELVKAVLVGGVATLIGVVIGNL